MKNYMKTHETMPAGLASLAACRRSFSGGASFAQRHRQAFGGRWKAQQAGKFMGVPCCKV